MSSNSVTYKGCLIERLGGQRRYINDEGVSVVVDTPGSEHYRLSYQDAAGKLCLITHEFDTLEQAKVYVDGREIVEGPIK